jgi:photosystem II stability/assembly factor-like uncharacterized protein
MRINKPSFGLLGILAFFALSLGLVCSAAQMPMPTSTTTVQIAARPVIDAYFLPSGYGWIVATDKHREFLFTTHDGGDHWSQEQLNLPIAAIFFLDDKQGFGIAIAGRDFSLVQTKNGGRNWQSLCAIPEISSDTTLLNSLVLGDSATAWVVGSQARGLDTVLQLDTTKCTVKKPFHRSNEFGLARAMFGDKESGELWIVGNDSIVYSPDSGKSWKPQVKRSSLREATSFNAGVALGSGAALVVGGGVGGTVYRTMDHGLHWDLVVQSPDSHWLQGIYFWDSGHGCTVGGSAILLCTGDGGNTWQAKEVLPRSKNSLTKDIFTKVLFVKGGSRGWALGNGGFIFQTDDGGNSWRPLDLFSVE